MDDYYTETLAARRLKRCYDIAPLRVQQYLESEIQYVLDHVEKNHSVLELGCGYGRVLQPLSEKAIRVVGIDTSFSSLVLAKELIGLDPRIDLVQGDAA
ncbi:MAG: class I SAM-dependent methyltransferase, partial [Candidatus Thorarchaeota archaeon]